MSFGDLFRPLKQWNKSSYKVNIAKEKQVKAVSSLPVSKQAPKVEANNQVSSSDSIDWRKPSLVIDNLTQRVQRLVESKEILQCNILDLSGNIEPSVFSWFNNSVANVVPINYKVVTPNEDQELSDHSLASLHEKNLHYKADVILAWNVFQYGGEEEVKALVEQLTPLCHSGSLIYFSSCQYLVKLNQLESSHPQNNLPESNQLAYNLPSVSFKLTSKESSQDDIRAHLSAQHKTISSAAAINVSHYSLGNISRLLGMFEIIKVNNNHNPEVYEAIARLKAQ